MTDKKTIQGIPTKFDARELNRRQQQHKAAYQQTSQCCEIIRGAIPQQFLQAVSDKIAEGYTLSKYPITMESLNYSAQLVKPPAMQEVDIATINNEVREAYRAELEASHEDYKQRLFAQLVQAEESKQAAKAQAAKDKVYADLKRQADQTYSPLVFPEA
ncbi:hypothetical protein [Pseudomonas bubulae]|uniref:hypothetical protein n=1 Tax=Pseudomonas bubulae TaxID=2316085 RepID=UPI001F244ABC|nr:hypothetical protein [Pseudomonas bubulae]MCF3193333.1 hypothetical protein [Pseudomonas bubulae]